MVVPPDDAEELTADSAWIGMAAAGKGSTLDRARERPNTPSTRPWVVIVAVGEEECRAEVGSEVMKNGSQWSHPHCVDRYRVRNRPALPLPQMGQPSPDNLTHWGPNRWGEVGDGLPGTALTDGS